MAGKKFYTALYTVNMKVVDSVRHFVTAVTEIQSAPLEHRTDNELELEYETRNELMWSRISYQ